MFLHKTWYRTRLNLLLLSILFVCFNIFLCGWIISDHNDISDYFSKSSKHKSINNKGGKSLQDVESELEETLKYDKGTGCDIPKLDPFAKEIMQFVKNYPKLVCGGKDWVKCYLSKCRVLSEILTKYSNIECHYTDIMYKTDWKNKFGRTTKVHGADVYQLMKSDHVTVRCTGKENNKNVSSSWSGYGTGFRPVTPRPSPPGREDTLNVLIFGFDSTSRNGFIRKMPKSYKYVRDEMNATILKGYNILGDGTPPALLPILTGKMELELPDVRKSISYRTLDIFPFIFYKLRDDGYRTAYFEDMPNIGTFQYRFNGFLNQPADHYLRAMLMERFQNGQKFATNYNSFYCAGDTPNYKFMMNCTEQFMQLPGKKFIFNFIADISHNDFDKISTADDDTMQFLKNFINSDVKNNTLLVVMGDHGPRYANVRSTLQGKLEERLPLMALRLPEKLLQSRQDALSSLVHNAEVLTTPHDLHATIYDALDLRQHWNPYKVPGADLTRGLSLLKPIPASRSCSEAGVEPHWCACLSWSNVSSDESLYHRAASTLLQYINQQTDIVRSKCTVRTLTSIDWVVIHRMRAKAAKFTDIKEKIDYMANIRDVVQVKITIGPGVGVYEASLTRISSEDKLFVNPREISRINAYNNEPHCISATRPHLNPFCYCKD